MQSKIFLMAASLFFMVGATDCNSAQIHKVWTIDPDRGLVRDQDNEVIRFQDLPPCQELSDGRIRCEFAAVRFRPTVERCVELIQRYGP